MNMMEPEVKSSSHHDSSKLHDCHHHGHGHGHGLSQEEDDNGHVHFSVEQVATHESEIQVSYASKDLVHVHLGFLQIKHAYEITFCIKDNLCQDIESDPLQNLHVKMEKYEPTEDGEGHQLTVLFNAHKEKLVEESLIILDKVDSSKSLKLVFYARVLEETLCWQQGIFYMHFPIEETEHTTAFVEPFVEHWLEWKIAQTVTGKGKGTPALRNGIHCVKVEWDEDSEASDWQGFN